MDSPTRTGVGPEQLMALLDHTSAVVWMRDVTGRYLLVNHEYERLFGVRREDVVGHTAHDLFPGPVADRSRAADLATLRRGEPQRSEEQAGIRTFDTVTFPLAGDDGRAYAVCGVATDVTESRRAERTTQVLRAEFEAFAYSISHDLRAPLRSLEGFSNLLIEDHADALAEEAQHYLHRIQANAERMTQMLDDLLRLAKAAPGQLRREDTDLSAMARAVAAELAGREPDRPVEIDIPDGLVARGDPPLIQLVLENLLGNAWKFTAHRPDPVIRLGTERRAGVDVFTVRDNGAGFDMRHVERMFLPFQRLHGQQEFEGTGIGLAIVRRIIARHGGQIEAEGAPGEGAVIRFSLAPEDPGTGDA